MRLFRLLTKDEIECRVGEIAKSGKYLTLLLYKTARTDAALLDEVFGPERWQNDFKTIDGKLYGGIGIETADGKWIWKWDCGAESNIEAEKGEASDAFKRAGFKWGIGTELYSAPEIKIFSDKCEITEYNGKFRCYDKFSVQKIIYDENGKIQAVAIMNSKTKKNVFIYQREEMKKK